MPDEVFEVGTITDVEICEHRHHCDNCAKYFKILLDMVHEAYGGKRKDAHTEMMRRFIGMEQRSKS